MRLLLIQPSVHRLDRPQVAVIRASKSLHTRPNDLMDGFTLVVRLQNGVQDGNGKCRGRLLVE